MDVICFITIKTNHNIEIFNKDEYFTIIKNSINFCDKTYDSITLGFVLMPDHLHWLLFVESKKLRMLIKNFKGYTANKLIKSVRKYDYDLLCLFLVKKRAKGKDGIDFGK